MNINELKILAYRIDELNDEGVLSIYPNHTEGYPSVHLSEAVFDEFAEGREVEVKEHDNAYDRHRFFEDGVEFFTLKGW